MSDKTYTIDELVDGLIRIADRIEWKQIPDKIIRGTHNGITIEIIDKLVMDQGIRRFIYEIQLNNEVVFEDNLYEQRNSKVSELWFKINDIFFMQSKTKFDDMCNKLFNESF